jgi:hypothetical protein
MMEKPNAAGGSSEVSSPTDAQNVADAQKVADAAQHVAGAHEQLKTLRDRLGILNRHPELEEALTKLEMALSALSVSTGGMW